MRHKWLYIVLFVLTVMLLAFPAVQQHAKLFKFKPLFGAVVATEPPQLTLQSFMDGSFQQQEDQYLSEHIGFREPLVRGYNQFCWSLFRKVQNETIFVNDDNWIFNDYTVKHYYGQSVYDFVSSDESAIKKMNHDAIMLYQLQSLLEEYGVPFFVCLAPGKDVVFGEHVPEVKGFNRPPGILAIDYYPPLFDSLGINYINFSQYYLDIKDTVSYPLYLKSSSHWSNEATAYAADTLFRYMENLCGFNMHNLILGDRYLDKTHFLDSDLEDIMNLMWPIESGENYYVRIAIDDDSTAIKPKLFTVGDSYFKGFYYNFSLDRLFESYHFWYYANSILYDPLHDNVKQADVLRELLSSDVVMLMYSPCNLYDLNREFLTNALFNFYYDDKVVAAKLREVQQSDEGLSETDARYLLYNFPGYYFPEFKEAKVASCRSSRFEKVLAQMRDPQRMRFRREIMHDPKWLESEKQKAEIWHITIDEAIERDIDYIQESLSDESLGLDGHPESVVGVVP
ncbi:MAG: hypothetical protein II887_08205 [Bacteroidales bacterium]|nr:hypothetical protein [Bacteroidales bacterium]